MVIISAKEIWHDERIRILWILERKLRLTSERTCIEQLLTLLALYSVYRKASVNNEKTGNFFSRSILLLVQLKDSAGSEREARKFATASCHGQPASFASRSYQSVHGLYGIVDVEARLCIVTRSRETRFIGRD